MRRTSAGWVFLVGLLGPGSGPAADTVPVSQVVPPYIGDGLELAVTPWPQEADLSGRLLATPGLEVQAPDTYAHPFTVKDAGRFAAALNPSPGPKPPAGAVKL